MGGQSAEREISLKTGSAVCKALTRRGYRVIPIDVDSTLPWQLRTKKVDVAFVALHGPGGEDGTVQGLLEVLRIPYTGSGIRASVIAMDKVLTKTLFRNNRIPVPPGIVLHKEPSKQIPSVRLKLPMVVKPASQGSTIGVTIVRQRSAWESALQRAYQYGSTAVVESYIAGREVAVSVVDGKAFPTVEIVAPGGFYDYASKYKKKVKTRYFCPAPLSHATLKKLENYAVRAYTVVGCEGVARVDFRINRQGRPFALEVNTIPGMTERSLLPMAAARAGLPYDSLVEIILESAIRIYQGRGGRQRSLRRQRVSA